MKWIAGAVAAIVVLLTPLSAHAPAAPKLTDLWLAPAVVDAAPSDLAAAVQALADGKAASALPVFAKAASAPLIGGYARLYQGRAALALNQLTDAHAVAMELAAAPAGASSGGQAGAGQAVAQAGATAGGYLREASLLFAASVAEASDDAPGALTFLNDALPFRPPSPSTIWLRIGRAAQKTGDREQAVTALTKVYFDYPLSDDATEAAKDLAAPGMPGVAVTRENYTRAKARAAALFDARRFTDARKAIDAAWPLASGADRDLFALRRALCDLGGRKYAAALDGLAPFAANGPFQLDAQYGSLGALRGLGKGDDYVTQARAFITAHPESSLADDALNDLANYYTTNNDDTKAADVFGELYRAYPSGAHAERAAWKAGWWAYKTGSYPETARLFDEASVRMPHADTRPSWLYWAAKAHQRAGERDAAIEGYRRTIAAYRNLYYGREATRELKALAAASPASGPSDPPDVPRATLEFPAGQMPANAVIITRLLGAGMWDEALGELRYAERASGTSPLIQATQAYAWGKKGDLRTGITLMKRAYPQFMAAGGEALPEALQHVIYPVAYWDLITKYATARKLDPAIMAALIAQESTFQADVRSAANAWGLMQIVPATGREYALHLGIKPFSTARLTEPVVNIRIGMAYFADLTRQFNDLPAALASYNAGENRAARWIAERPGLARDEFIDDIPFPETQGYVRRIIGTAEDYRRLYPEPAAAKR
jgi:soluble lytic murein transglycosylase